MTKSPGTQQTNPSEPTHPQADASGRDPIAAVFTGKGASAVTGIRISGPNILALLKPLLSPRGKGAFEHAQMRLCSFRLAKQGEVLDEPMAVYFQGPKSYTGEDTVEVYAHGSPYVVSTLLQALFAHGFRAARPGEFTERAFLNGKLSLLDAEGIHELISAQTKAQWSSARALMSGRLAKHILVLREQLVSAMAHLEALIDFPDEGDTDGLAVGQHVKPIVKQVEKQAHHLLTTYRDGQVAAQGLKVVLLGPPNAGKSTLLNTLLKQDRAIVTDIAGTTRDYLEESCLIQGRLIRLIDTAGLRETQDEIEQLGIEKSRNLAQDADVVLHLLPVSPDATSEDSREKSADQSAFASADHSHSKSAWTPQKISKRISEHLNDLPEESEACSHILLLTKVDRLAVHDKTLGEPPGDPLRALKATIAGPDLNRRCLGISCKSAEGLADLEQRLCEEFDRHLTGLEGEEAYLTAPRHEQALHDTLACFERFYEAEEQGMYEECLAFELQTAARTLTELVGRIDSEDVLDSLFRSFCMGK